MKNIIFVVIYLFITNIKALDLKLQNGTEYKNINIIKISKIAIRFKYNEKDFFIPLSKLDKKSKSEVLKLLPPPEYLYNRKEISKKRFNKLFKVFKKYYYYNDTNENIEIFDLRCGNDLHKGTQIINENPNLCKLISFKEAFCGQYGILKGEVLEIINSNTLRVRIGNYNTNIGIIKNSDASLFHDGSTVYKIVKCVGNQSDTSIMGANITVPLFVELHPITEEIFKDYIKMRKLFIYKKIENIIKGHKAKRYTCNKCKGKGRLKNINVNLNNSAYVRCHVCGGKGFITKGHTTKDKKEIIWKKIYIN